MRPVYYIFSISIYFSSVFGKLTYVAQQQQLITTQRYMVWPNATVPFYVNPDHFDHEQSLKILTALSMFAFKTCLKFAPVMALPSSNEHVMVFVNPAGVKRCVFDSQGHSFYEPHLVTLGYDCLKTPHLEMIIMKALGFPFEHNRAIRDQYIEVMLENVDPGATEMFTRDINEPAELRILPYDYNSVMHFGNREFSRNGHRTIIFKDPNIEQNRNGLTSSDVRKFDVIYGSECLKRDRQEKIDICQSYPGVARRKRETEQKDETKPEDVVTHIVTKSLRVNPHITPPPQEITDDVNKSLKELGIEEQVQSIVENVYKVSETALSNARTQYCKSEKASVRTQDSSDKATDILGIINLVSDYAKGMVDRAVTNITEFCEGSETIETYLRARCDWEPNNPRCVGNFKSTKHGMVQWSTQHRPIIVQSTKYERYKKNIYAMLRDGNSTIVLGEDNKEENKETKDEGETWATEKMQPEKLALRFGATGPPRNRKSLQKHRRSDSNVKDVWGVLKKGYERNQALEISSENDQPQRQPTIYSNEENENIGNKEFVNVNSQSNEEINFKSKIRQLKKESDIEESLQKDEGPSSEVQYERDMVLNEDQIKNYEPVVTIPNSRFKIKNPEDSEEKVKKRHKKLKNKPIGINLDLEEGENQKIKHHIEIAEVEPKEMVEENDHNEDRVKKQRKRQKKIKENYNVDKLDKEIEEDEPKEMVEENNFNGDTVKKQKKRQKKIKENNDNVDINRDQEPITEKTTEQSLPPTITLSKQNKEFYKDRKWPGGLVRYVLKSGLGYDEKDLRRRLEEVNSILKERTCVRLKEITENESENVEDFLLIDNSPDYVTGRVGGKQNFGSVELLQGGQHRQHTAMMVMAMLGFYFEVARHDRDKYIRVHMRHVRPDKLHHFEKIRSDATLAVPYDYQSATHPAWQFWRQYGRSGISTVATFKEKDPEGKLMKSLGQNPELLSETDILKINSVYGVRCFLRTKKRLRNKLSEKQQKNGERQDEEMQYAAVAK